MFNNIFDEFLKIKGKHKFVFRDTVTNEIIRANVYENLIVNACKNMITTRLAGTGNACIITYGAVGTNATSPLISDTILGTELARSALVSITASTLSVLMVTFFGASEANGTLNEFGLFGEAASATPDSGTLICHTSISETKTPSETLTIESTISIT